MRELIISDVFLKQIQSDVIFGSLDRIVIFLSATSQIENCSSEVKMCLRDKENSCLIAVLFELEKLLQKVSSVVLMKLHLLGLD